MGGQHTKSAVPDFWTSFVNKIGSVMLVHTHWSPVYVVLLVGSCFCLAFGRPINNEQHPHRHGRGGVYDGLSEESQIEGTTYLMKFGYLPGSDLETGALRTSEELHRSVRHFQRYAHIPETGILDENTLEMMKKPRCGMADLIHGHHRHTDGENGPPSGYTLGPSKWQKKWLSIRLLNYTPDLNYQNTRDSIIRALFVWSDVAQLSFHEVQSGHADIYIQFSSGYHHDGYPFDGPGMVLAHAFFPGDDRGGDIHFDEDERWTMWSEQGVNLFMVAAHELGHSLGLAHSNVPGSLMFPWHQGYNADFKLHPDDIVAIQYLYGPKMPPQQPPYYPSSNSSTTQPPNRPVPTQRTHYYPNAHPTPSTTQKPLSLTTSYRWTTLSSSIAHSTRSTTSKLEISTTTTAVTTQKRHGGHGGAATTHSGFDSSIPDPCRSIDALSVIRGETFLFSGKWFWRINSHGVMDGFPVEIHRFWYGFPVEVRKVDAVFERSSDGRIIFFSADKYWEFNGNYVVGGSSADSGKPISDFGLPRDVDHVDAVFVWGHNRRAYVIAGDMYWKLNETGRGIETYNYPRDMSMWTGVSLPVDSAFTYTDGHTYFFKGSEYWQFNNARMHVRHGYPKPIAEKWLLKCVPGDWTKGTETSDGVTRPFAAHMTGTMNQIVPLPATIILMLLLLSIVY